MLSINLVISYNRKSNMLRLLSNLVDKANMTMVTMVTMDKNLSEILSVFGLDQKETEVYLLLAKTGWTTVLDLSRKCEVKRSTLYRILGSLEKRGFVEVKVDDFTTYYQITDPRALEARVIEQTKIADKMKEGIRLLQSQLLLPTQEKKHHTEIHFHRGEKGIRLVEWKMAQVNNSETFIFATNEWVQATSPEFAEEVTRKERLLHNARIKELSNEEHFGPIPKTGSVSWTKNKEYLFNTYRHRLIPKKILPITNEVMIQGETMYFYGLESGEVVVVEMISPSYASLMTGLFNMAWQQAKVMDQFGQDGKHPLSSL